MKIVYFTKYSRLGASSRLRSFQFESYYQMNQMEVSYFSLFDDEYLLKLYQNKSISFLKVLYLYFRRFFQLFRVFEYDQVIIEKELFPYLPPLFEQILSLLKVSYIVDYDDAIFHNYDMHPNKYVQKLLGKKIAHVMRNSAVVTVGNQYLKSYAVRSGAKSVVILPTVIDLSRYTIQSPKANKTNRKISIGWIGSPSTFKYFKTLENVIRVLNQKYELEWHVIGADWDDKPLDIHSVIFKKWSEKEEVNMLNQVDIGIMPLHETPWENGKCAYKIIQYMALGLPVVASPVGVNSEIVKHGENGFLATQLSDWELYLETLIENKELQKKFGQKGRYQIIEKFTVENNFRVLSELFKMNQNGST